MLRNVGSTIPTQTLHFIFAGFEPTELTFLLKGMQRATKNVYSLTDSTLWLTIYFTKTKQESDTFLFPPELVFVLKEPIIFGYPCQTEL
jgi:hypothetical protein